IMVGTLIVVLFGVLPEWPVSLMQSAAEPMLNSPTAVVTSPAPAPRAAAKTAGATSPRTPVRIAQYSPDSRFEIPDSRFRIPAPRSRVQESIGNDDRSKLPDQNADAPGIRNRESTIGEPGSP